MKERGLRWASLSLFLALVSTGMSACIDREIYDPGPKGIIEADFDALEEQPLVEDASVLFIVDDSVSMADKQALLQRSLERLLITPLYCTPPVTEDGLRGRRKPVEGRCPEGWPFAPAIPGGPMALLTTSMEAGGAGCPESSRAAHLVSSVASGARELVERLSEVGEAGCGYESPLEAMYRFLVDPAPPRTVTTEMQEGKRVTVTRGVDEELLAQRQEFLAPLANLIIVVLTDEDDCSVRDFGDAWQIAQSEPLARAASVCAEEPDSPCCRPCDDAGPTPEGCVALEEDRACVEQPRLKESEDLANLRCFEQRRRFGKEFLFPVQRYVDALQSPTVQDREGKEHLNPLFAHGRTPDQISVILLSGTPWQLLQKKSSTGDFELSSSQELIAAGTWDKLLGGGQEAIDPHLIESPWPRPGLARRGAWDPIHGFEVERENADELQYSCIFDLPESVDCKGRDGCLCRDADELPLCQDEEGRFDTVQRRSQAYPSPRLLEWARALGSRAVVGSVCPPSTRYEGEGIEAPRRTSVTRQRSACGQRNRGLSLALWRASFGRCRSMRRSDLSVTSSKLTRKRWIVRPWGE